ncbi:MAG TPA: glycosyltransferase [Actinomycetota bacterium]|nr:glycosyltransferase [Actinomycetota bacterium]
MSSSRLRIGHYYSDLMHPGGLPADARSLIAAQLGLGHDVVGFGLGPPKDGLRPPEGMDYVFDERSPAGVWKLARSIVEGPRRPDVLTVWSALNPGNEIILRSAHRAGVPTVLTPHGVLSPKLYETGRALPKRLYRTAGTAPSLRRWVDVLHAVSPQEEADARALGFVGPAFVFSFGTPQVPELDGPGPLRAACGVDEREVIVGFFGRMDLYQKGLDVLIAAFALCGDLVEDDGVTFVLAGKGSPGEWDRIRDLLGDHRIANLVRTVGPFAEPDRFAALADLDVLIHPSRFDGITRVMRESAPLGIPSIVTPEANAQLLVDVGAAKMVELEPRELAAAIRQTAAEEGWRRAASDAARAWASENTWESCARRFDEAYERARRVRDARGERREA